MGSYGIELLPVGCAITEARQAAEQVDIIRLKKEIEALDSIDFRRSNPIVRSNTLRLRRVRFLGRQKTN